jgi:PIN domain nuclease of toxin-antitoxin system
VILLLDAHAVVWWLDDDPQLAKPARSAISDPANAVLVSAATIWELGIKHALGKLDLQADLPEAVEQAGFSSIPVTATDAWAAAVLPAHHRDPFDRMLVAQASRLGALIVSRDSAFAAYEVDILTA